MPLVFPVLGSVYSLKMSACGCAPEEEAPKPDDGGPADDGAPDDEVMPEDEDTPDDDGEPDETSTTLLLPNADEDNSGKEEPCAELAPEPAAELG